MNQKKQTITDLKPFQSAVSSLRNIFKERGDKPELGLLSMPDLSFKLWGLHKRKMLIVGARTSNGKTVMAINMAWDLVKQKKNVMFLSLEMPIERIVERIFCLEKKVNNVDLLMNGYNKSQEIRDKFEEFQEERYYNFVLSDCIGKDWDFVDGFLKNLTGKPDVIFIDHIQEVRGTYSQKQIIDDYLSKLRESAIRNNFALVICSQINRIAPAERENKEPQLHHLKSSGNLEEVADQVILLHWDWHYDNSKPQSELLVNIAKNRDGLTGRMKMYFEPSQYRINNFAKKQETTERGCFDESQDPDPEAQDLASAFDGSVEGG